MSMNEITPCSDIAVDVISSCIPYTWKNDITYTTSNSTATHILTSSAGCDSVVTLNLTIDAPDLSVIQTGTTLSSNQLGASYQWLDCATMNPIVGAMSQTYSVTANGNYAVIVNKNGCSDTSSCYNVTSVGLIQNNFENELIVYPNPTNGKFSIDLGAHYNSVTVTITDLLGRTIQSKTYKNSQLLDFTLKEPAGVYLLMIESIDTKKAIRLIKE